MQIIRTNPFFCILNKSRPVQDSSPRQHTHERKKPRRPAGAVTLNTLADQCGYASTTIVDGLTVTPLPSESPTGQRLSMKCLNA